MRVVPTFVSFWPTQPSGTIDATCRLMVSVVRASVAQRLHRLVAGRPSGVVRCRISFVRHARSVWHSEARNQVCKLICITVRVTGYARKIFNFKTARLAYSGARDCYPIL